MNNKPLRSVVKYVPVSHFIVAEDQAELNDVDGGEPDEVL